MADYEIRLNNTSVRGICPSCGDDFKPRWGEWPFVPGSLDALCETCATGRDLTTPGAYAEMDKLGRAFRPRRMGAREF